LSDPGMMWESVGLDGQIVKALAVSLSEPAVVHTGWSLFASHSCTETLATAVDGPATSFPISSNSSMTTLVQRNALAQVPQLR